jgi:hypothetical protein
MHDSNSNTRTTGSDPIKISQDDIRIDFDWEVPVTSLVTFETRIERKGQANTISYTVDRAKLSVAELSRLEIFLARRHAGMTSAVEVTRTAAWLLDISLAQDKPELSVNERQGLIRSLLLAGPSEVQSAASAGREVGK